MALINCPDCGTEISDTAPTCVKCGRPKPVSASKKRQTHPITWLVLLVIIVVVAYQFFISKETKQAINRAAANTGITITPWIDRAESGLEAQLMQPAQRTIFGKSVITSLHPIGTFHELSSHRIERHGNVLQLELTAAWKGGLLGTAYSTTVVWECNEKGHIKTVVTQDNGPFGFGQSNLDALDKWFRTEVWPIVDSNAGG